MNAEKGPEQPSGTESQTADAEDRKSKSGTKGEAADRSFVKSESTRDDGLVSLKEGSGSKAKGSSSANRAKKSAAKKARK